MWVPVCVGGAIKLPPDTEITPEQADSPAQPSVSVNIWHGEQAGTVWLSAEQSPHLLPAPLLLKETWLPPEEYSLENSFFRPGTPSRD